MNTNTKTRITVVDGVARLTLSTSALYIAGLDDVGRFVDVERVAIRRGSMTVCRGTVRALVELVTELHDRATEGADGFAHSAADKRVLRRAVAAAIRQGVTPRGEPTHTLDAPSVVGPDFDTRDHEGADEPHAADVTTDAGIDDVPHEDYPGQYVDGPDTLPTVLTLDEKVAIEIARRDRSADAWQQLPVVACRSVGCDQRFKREHAAQTICRDCMSYEPGTFTFYPIDAERAPWHARTKRSPAGAESSAPLMPTIARLTGRCANGAERDGGRVSHVVMSTRLSPTWEAALCGATPGRKSS